MVSRSRVAGLHLLWLQELINIFPGLRKVLYSNLDRLNFQCQPADTAVPSQWNWRLSYGLSVEVWEQVVLSACSKQEVKHIGLMKYLCFKHQLACVN